MKRQGRDLGHGLNLINPIFAAMTDLQFFSCMLGIIGGVVYTLINSKLNTILMKQTEVAAELIAVKEQLVKVKTEVITAVNNALALAGEASPELVEALNAVKAAVTEVDDLNPDQTEG